MTKAATKPERGDDLAPSWLRMLALFIEKRDAMFDVLHGYGLTPPHAHALSVLATSPHRMRDIADSMTCDASYITAIVDRLESGGLAERRVSPTDRRVKEIALTERGTQVADEIRATMTSPPEAFALLSRADRAMLATLLAKIVPDLDTLPDPFRPPNRR